MKTQTSVDVLTALLAVKELEIHMKNERINQLITMYNALYDENTKLLIEKTEKPVDSEDHTVGFKKGGGK